jgi:cullin 1
MARDDCETLAQLADVMWKEKFFVPMQTRLTNAMIALITEHRNGQPIDTGIITDTVQCYGKQQRDSVVAHSRTLVRLGSHKENPKMSNLEIYTTTFEKAFIAATDVYYTVESTSYLHENGVSEYLKKAEKRIAEEMDRLAKFLHPSSAGALNATLDEVLVRKHITTLHAKAAPFLADELKDDLKRLYTLLLRCGKSALEPMQDTLEQFIAANGRNALTAELDAAAANPDVFVAILLRVFRKFHALIKEAFNDDPGFVAAQDKVNIDTIDDV